MCNTVIFTNSKTMYSTILSLLVLLTNMCLVGTQSSCKTPHGITGTCMPILDCKPLLELMLNIINKTNKTPEDEEFLKKSQCGFREIKPKICCPPEKDNVIDCLTPDNNSGQCVDIHQCKHMATMLKPPVSQETITFLQKSRCAGRTEQSVCCGPAPASKPLGLAPENCEGVVSAFPPDPSTGCCGVQTASKERILGVNVTKLDEYPWLALIEYYKDDVEKLLCAGTLISGRYVLTAAHCVVGEVLKVGSPRNVRLGEYDTSSLGPDCVEVEAGLDCTDEALSIPIESIIPHPDFSLNFKHKNDIALIRLRALAPVSDFVRPICLPQKDITQHPPSDLFFYQAGWGEVSTRPFQVKSNVKLHASLPFVSQQECQKSYETPRRKAKIGSTVMCAGGQSYTLCKGNSGGPLMHEKAGIFEAVGISSFGPVPCGVPNIPDVYTKIFEYKDWILSNIKP